MKEGDKRADGDEPGAEGPWWHTGTSVDPFTSIYTALLSHGIGPDAADRMDMSLVARLLLDVAGERAEAAAPPVPPPPVAADGSHIPGTAPPGIKPPTWWRGDQAAFDGMVRANQELQDGGTWQS